MEILSSVRWHFAIKRDGLSLRLPDSTGGIEIHARKKCNNLGFQKKYIQQYILQSGYTPDISTVCTISVSVHNTQSPGQAAEFNDTWNYFLSSSLPLFAKFVQMFDPFSNVNIFNKYSDFFTHRLQTFGKVLLVLRFPKFAFKLTKIQSFRLNSMMCYTTDR